MDEAMRGTQELEPGVTQGSRHFSGFFTAQSFVSGPGLRMVAMRIVKMLASGKVVLLTEPLFPNPKWEQKDQHQ